MSAPIAFGKGPPTPGGVGIDAHARPNLVSTTARHNAFHIYPHSCIRVVVPNFPQKTWVDPGEGTFT